MSARTQLARRAVDLGILRVAPAGQEFPGRRGGPPAKALMDVRAVASNAPLQTLIIGALLHALGDFPAGAVLGGLSRGGLVLGAQLALVARRSFVAVLPEGPRASGLQRAVEGDVTDRDVVLFDNVLNSGASLRDAAAHVERAGGRVAGALVVGTYQKPRRLPFKVRSLFGFNDLLRAASSSTRQTNHNPNRRKPQ